VGVRLEGKMLKSECGYSARGGRGLFAIGVGSRCELPFPNRGVLKLGIRSDQPGQCRNQET
jgi:hypothetical protein